MQFRPSLLSEPFSLQVVHRQGLGGLKRLDFLQYFLLLLIYFADSSSPIECSRCLSKKRKIQKRDQTSFSRFFWRRLLDCYHFIHLWIEGPRFPPQRTSR